VGETSANNKKSPADLIYLLENTVDRLKSKDLFALPKFVGWLRH